MPILQKLYQIRAEQLMPISIDEAWDFFKNPMNLREITPEELDFKVTSEMESDEMYEGMLITYIVKPVLGIPMRWCTEITHIQEKKMFIDEQRFGPYNMWHHEHWFYETDQGVLMKDIVTYGIPLGILGQLANSLFVHNQVKQIFEYRNQVIDKKFGTPSR